MKTKTSILKKFQSLDFFGHGVSFLVNGNDKSQSIFGAFVSLFCSVLVCAYSIYQFQLMCRYSNTSISYIMNKNVFEDTEKIQTSRLGFNIAFGFIDFSTFKGIEGIEKLGKFSAQNMIFDTKNINYEQISIHKCTEEDKYKFYKPNKVYSGNFDLLFSEFYCITNPEKLVFNGDFNGDLGSGIILSFEECDNKTSKNCLEKEKKKEYFS